MAVKFANRMNLLKGSEIRALLALTAKPEVISFAGGMPAPELFPTEGVKEAACKVMVELRCSTQVQTVLHPCVKKSLQEWQRKTISM
jgi:DNA-binding transcriptional MocR family regulator